MEKTFKIVDLGNSIVNKKYYDLSIGTSEYRCPESILGSMINETADIWAAACLAFELATGDYLFEPEKGNRFSGKEDHLCQMMELLGAIPKILFCKGSNYYKYFDFRGRLVNIKSYSKWFKLLYSYYRDIFGVLNQKYNWKRRLASDFSQFLLPMLNYSYIKRSTAAHALKSDWLSSVE
uniref:non-specific serine/threonine protein kinase n=1 Tax=Myxobolus squamalis TaxID=59785 RepID=A0A6B2G131_MYXSQ